MASQQRRARSRRLAFIAATVAASAALASGPGVAAGVVRVAEPPAPTPAVTPAPDTTSTAPQVPAAVEPVAPAKDGPAFGAYLDYGARGVARIAELSDWLGDAELRVGHTYLPGDRWSNIEGAPGFLDVWADWRLERDDRMLVLNVPMMERNEERVSDAEVRTLLQQGAPETSTGTSASSPNAWWRWRCRTRSSCSAGR